MEELKLITYNIDGLPDKLDLKDLPWILKPIAWIYKIFKGNTIIKINDNSEISSNILNISDKLAKSYADIIGVQEDFNYHDELMAYLDFRYNESKHTGKFDLSKLFSRTEWLSYFPFPRFKCDGLNLLTNEYKVEVLDEKIIPWKKSHGYFKSANDKLTHKGFRYYFLSINGSYYMNLYLVHLDADFYNKDTNPDIHKDVAARAAQLEQLSNYIITQDKKGYSYPSIIMGDFNSSPDYQWDILNIYENLLTPISTNVGKIEEIKPKEKVVDRIFYINSKKSNYTIQPINCVVDDSFNGESGRLSDHRPVIATIKIS